MGECALEKEGDTGVSRIICHLSAIQVQRATSDFSCFAHVGPLCFFSHTKGVSQSLNTLITSLLTQLDNLVGIGRVPYLLLKANYARNVRNRIKGARDN